jgi:hypothetical protein
VSVLVCVDCGVWAHNEPDETAAANSRSFPRADHGILYSGLFA